MKGENLSLSKETDAAKKDDSGLLVVASWGLEVLTASKAEEECRDQ